MELRYEVYIGAQPEKVWDSFMSPEGARKIFYGSKFKSTGQIGDSFQYVGPGQDGDETVHLYGQILAYEPGKIVSLLEHPGPSYEKTKETWPIVLSNIKTLAETGKTLDLGW